ncbi:Predicted PurR-regulated permease PerM [Desulfonatronum thiosulfatophilum]|uniref:Predicted PurR-regulated permease PerM n=1 Tax=Desulfonatronum thiosulfatophilum TaxID=617002 RepID=A0A1G6D5A6_9BACT|nr:AI-2E family transporter [Desulfonatronum thiosulfatophilum]SDB40308.1 Predicted PurR-regulated permease PerM [Desulfonatronum thiosulfatophilum]
MSDQPKPTYPVIEHRTGVADQRWFRTDRVLLLGALSLLIWLIGDVLLLMFASVLLAVGLDGLAAGIAKRTPLKRGWALALVLVLLAGSLGLLGYLILPQFFAQVDDLWRTFMSFIERMQEKLSAAGWTETFLDLNEENGREQLAEISQKVAGHLATATTMGLSAIASLIILLAITIFAAADPELYRRGVLRLFPVHRRQRLGETFSAIAHALRWWFLGQIISMLLLGVSVSLGLMLIGIDLWLSLGVLTAFLTFIPFLGPIIATIPIVIIGFAEGAQTGLIVLVFYLIIQNIEGNFIVPMIQHRVVNLAPALLISVQVAMGVLFGVLGLILAAPLTVVAMIMVKMLYVEDVVEGDAQVIVPTSHQ